MNIFLCASLFFVISNCTSNKKYTRLSEDFRQVEVFNQDNQTWQRIALALGWDQWSLGIDPYKDVKNCLKPKLTVLYI